MFQFLINQVYPSNLNEGVAIVAIQKPFQSLINQVYPSNSLQTVLTRLSKGFQSLINQVHLSDRTKATIRTGPYITFQSLLHQVHLSDLSIVAIGWIFFTKFQSLINQVYLSDRNKPDYKFRGGKGFNPLFIRSTFQTVGISNPFRERILDAIFARLPFLRKIHEQFLGKFQ